MVYLTGDTHGDLDRFRHGRLRWLGKRDIVVVLGDFGFVWDGSAEEQKKLDWLRKRPYTLLFLDGSHENYDLLAQYPETERFGGRVQSLGGNVYHVCRGSVLELEMGFGHGRILFRHLLPNAMFGSIVFSMSDAVLVLLNGAAVSYLGLGVQPPTAEWGTMIAEGQAFITTAWWICTFPGLAIVTLAMGFSLLADGVAQVLGDRS